MNNILFMNLFAMMGILSYSSCHAFETVPSLNVSAYLGTWYQVYADRFTLDTFENNTYCTVAEYSQSEYEDNTYMIVLNTERYGSPSGPIHNVSGYAYAPNSKEPGQLYVRFPPNRIPAPYWILALGPINQDGLYEFSVVSDFLLLSLFVLVRNIPEFFTVYNQQLLTNLTTLGFTDYWNSPIEIPQQGCWNWN
jgi:lipocalin